MRFGLRNFGEGNNRDSYAKQESNSVLVTANNYGILSISHLGRKRWRPNSQEFIQKDEWNEMYLKIETYEDLMRRGWLEPTGWIVPKGRVIVLYVGAETESYDVFLIDIMFE